MQFSTLANSCAAAALLVSKANADVTVTVTETLTPKSSVITTVLKSGAHHKRQAEDDTPDIVETTLDDPATSFGIEPSSIAEPTSFGIEPSVVQPPPTSYYNTSSSYPTSYYSSYASSSSYETTDSASTELVSSTAASSDFVSSDFSITIVPTFSSDFSITIDPTFSSDSSQITSAIDPTFSSDSSQITSAPSETSDTTTLSSTSEAEPTSTWESPWKDFADRMRDRLTDFINNSNERFKKIITDIHNLRRKWEDDRKNLTWNERLEKYSNEILDKIRCDLEKLLDPGLENDSSINTANYGINVATGYENLQDAVDSWYQKGKPSANKRIHRRDGVATSNYEQMLAAEASDVGCAVRKCGRKNVLLCAYNKKA